MALHEGDSYAIVLAGPEARQPVDVLHDTRLYALDGRYVNKVGNRDTAVAFDLASGPTSRTGS
ncbi:hypothetical protein [Streptomyces sp. NPDC051921]|uniref:hypothetical protein n=1 Tax=Streptomyces sp. NPDC051921 TaxID=3155806 RepID=UPI003443402F